MGRYFSALFARKRLLLYELKAVGRSENLWGRGATTDHLMEQVLLIFQAKYRGRIAPGPWPPFLTVVDWLVFKKKL